MAFDMKFIRSQCIPTANPKDITMAKIEVGKTYKTREGRSARILATDLEGDFPIIGLIDNIKIVTWTSEGLSGLFSGEHRLDIMPETERKVRWVNVYEDSTSGQFAHRESADACAAVKRLGILKFTYENDELVGHEYEKLK